MSRVDLNENPRTLPQEWTDSTPSLTSSTPAQAKTVAAAPQQKQPAAPQTIVESFPAPKTRGGTPVTSCVDRTPQDMKDLASSARKGEGPHEPNLPEFFWNTCDQALVRGVKIASTDGEQRVPKVAPKQLLEAFVLEPNNFLFQAGLKLLPAERRPLQAGYPYVLEQEGAEPRWIPVRIQVDRQKQTVRLDYASGAPARGFHELRFKPDGQGGTALERHGELQGTEGERGREIRPDELAAETRRMDTALRSIAHRGTQALDVLHHHGR